MRKHRQLPLTHIIQKLGHVSRPPYPRFIPKIVAQGLVNPTLDFLVKGERDQHVICLVW